MTGQIKRRGNSPLASIITTIIGIAILIITYTTHLNEVIQTTLLTIGTLFAVAGIIWCTLCLTKTLWHYHYLPGNTPMRDKTIYLSTADFRNCTEMLENGNTEALGTLRPTLSSNMVLRIIYSVDLNIALMQTCRMETAQQEPASPVKVLTGEEVRHISTLIH